MSEAYCSFEVARLLKEKGFGGFIPFGWNLTEKYPDLRNFIEDTGRGGYHDKKGDWLSCPTHQMAMKWLREKYYIYADPIKQGNYNDCSEYYTWIVARMGIIHRNSSVVDKLSYEEAVEAAIKYSLENLIK